MELVYLWVEDYKNIKKQGFNFSPKFSCHYDEKTKELTIDKNDDYIENFFGENINVTAIVGKNGSGKSSVLEFLLDRLANRWEDNPKNFIFLYLHKKKIYEYKNFLYKISSKIKVEEYPNHEALLDYYMNVITLYINNQREKIEVRDSEKLFIENHVFSNNYINKILIKNYMGEYSKFVKNTKSFFIPTQVEIKLKESFGSYPLNDDEDFYTNDTWEKIEKIKGQLEKKTFYERLLLIIEIFEIKYNEHKEVPLINFNENGISKGSFYKYKIEKYFIEKIPEIIQKNKSINLKLKVSEITPKVFEFINNLPYIFDITVLDNNKSFDNLSYGERQLLAQLNFILYYLSKESYSYHHFYQNNDEGEVDEYEDVNIHEIIVLLDEFELGLHPDWQKKFITYIVDFFKGIDKKINIILTSHSPFLLSDIPKQNIIFLDKDENGNCKVVDGLKEKKQTFGANIHTLLSDSFFMEDGFMGEFAKGKIDKAIKFLNQDKLSEEDLKYCEQIISIIGEPIVKNQLQRMLDSKKINYIAKDVKEEIEFLKHRIDLLSKRL